MFIPALASDLHLAKSNGLFSVLVLLHLLAPFDMIIVSSSVHYFLHFSKDILLTESSSYLTDGLFCCICWFLPFFPLIFLDFVLGPLLYIFPWLSSSSFNGFKDYLKSCDFQIYSPYLFPDSQVFAYSAISSMSLSNSEILVGYLIVFQN